MVREGATTTEETEAVDKAAVAVAEVEAEAEVVALVAEDPERRFNTYLLQS